MLSVAILALDCYQLCHVIKDFHSTSVSRALRLNGNAALSLFLLNEPVNHGI